MSARDENCQSEEHRAGLTRLPQLAEPTIQFNLAKELEQLHHAEAWDKTSGRSSKTLAKYSDFRIVLVSMKAKPKWSNTGPRAEFRFSVWRENFAYIFPVHKKRKWQPGISWFWTVGFPTMLRLWWRARFC